MRACIAALVTVVLSSPAWAQQPAPGKGVVTVERVENHWVLVPEAKLTDLNGDLGTLVGFTAGWLQEETLLIGGAGYWLTGGPSGWDLAYGGAIIGLQWHGDRPITFGGRALVGAGEASRTFTIRPGFPWVWPGPGPMPVDLGYGWRYPNVIPFPITRDVRIDMSNGFFVFEPQANLLLTITKHVRFGVSAGYRLTSGADAFGDDINGATGTVSIQFGVGGK